MHDKGSKGRKEQRERKRLKGWGTRKKKKIHNEKSHERTVSKSLLEMKGIKKKNR